MADIVALRERAGLSREELAGQTGYAVRTIYRWETGEAPARKAVVEYLARLIAAKEVAAREQRPLFTFIDLFAGIGGLRMGFEGLGGKCVFTCERDVHSQRTYRANFPSDSHEIAGDITKVDEDSVPAHDLLLAGFPCQPFSIAGVSKKNALGRPHGFRDEAQGTLFFDVARIIEKRRPAAFLLENVKNLRSHDGGRTFYVIMRTLTRELGYHVQFRILNAQGVAPQHRKRIFLAGFRDPTEFDFEALQIPEAETGPKLRTVLHPEDGSEEAEAPFTEGPGAAVAAKYVLTEHLWNYLQRYAEKHREKGHGFGFGLCGPEDVARTLSARYHKDGSEILIQHPIRPRRLTPRECARLMGFDGPGRAPFRIPVSDTQAYRQFGNAVVVPLVARVARHMIPHVLGIGAPSGTQLPLWVYDPVAIPEPAAARPIG
jgi:DNA (cytosine-5)-methyltransferase 1